MTRFKISFKIYSNLWISISEIFHNFYCNIQRIKFINLSFFFSFLKLYMHYTYMYIGHFDWSDKNRYTLIVDSSNIKQQNFVKETYILKIY